MEDCIRRMAALGVDALVEIGPGKALTGFAKKIVPGLPVYPVETVADVQALADSLAALAETKTKINNESEGDPA
jgi:[acyl-carrier-protein] S-malonyltransferase